jgi:3-dehydroquinate synthase II
MKEFWVLLDGLEKEMPKISGHLSNADVVVSRRLSKKQIEELLGVEAKVASPAADSDIQLFQDNGSFWRLPDMSKPSAVVVEISSGKDQSRVMDAFAHGASYVVLRCPDWKTIPLENIISTRSGENRVLMEVGDHVQARLALETLEVGSDGVLLVSASLEEITRTGEEIHNGFTSLGLVEVKITKKKDVGVGARACVDTTDLMKSGEGILVGCQSNGLFLVQAEVEENQFIASRPFRVNAGPISSYVLTAPDKTNYLSDLEAGHPVLIVDREGRTRQGCVGRVKIERRPMVLVEAEWQGKCIKTILQNAETIRLVTRDGSRSVSELETGSLVLARVEQGGRHFGNLVTEESIVER